MTGWLIAAIFYLLGMVPMILLAQYAKLHKPRLLGLPGYPIAAAIIWPVFAIGLLIEGE